MRLSKRASLEIGVNTIVILVIAMILMALAIGFVRGIFTKAGMVPEVINPESLQQPPDKGTPVRMRPQKLMIPEGGSATAVLSVYNWRTASAMVTLESMTCSPSGYIPNRNNVQYINPTYQAIDVGSSEGDQLSNSLRAGGVVASQVIISVPSAKDFPQGSREAASTYICQFVIKTTVPSASWGKQDETESIQFTIDVASA